MTTADEDWFTPADIAAMDALRRAEEAARQAEAAQQQQED